MRSLRSFAVLLSLVSAPTLPAWAGETPPPQAAPSEAGKQKCEHGVQKSLCTRCNPKLAPVYKSKGDWCAEHERPESQCVLCHPDLAQKGVK
ncbi:hypothetical protein [Stigmatella aurantiaca]|uniref:Uncharacterized protein n=1 Tax=Stigmatella aurantiaca (strain DW4/3-1) TaxID=378806 RepID=E3FG70_STIAD|nr:hypothetical protein [Stigmatella aurantiaca]ADO69005.1 uncharacterized protein STAUR_1201 [Stigmatella aurantiaca DW4/3-1]